MTVYYSQETDEVIGSLIKGASKFCNEMLKRMPGFRIEIQAGRVSLQHFFLARLWSEDLDHDDLHSLTYRKLLQCWFVVECVRNPCKKGRAATSRRTPKKAGAFPRLPPFGVAVRAILSHRGQRSFRGALVVELRGARKDLRGVR